MRTFLYLLLLLGLTGCGGPIPDGRGCWRAPRFEGTQAQPHPLAPKDVVPHPFLSPMSSIHSDSYNSDVDDFAGPLGVNPVVESAFIGTQFNVFLELALVPSDGGQIWRITRTVDLSPYLQNDDILIDTIPDWDGNIWFVSDAGVVGCMRADGGLTRTIDLKEFFENGLAIGSDGAVYQGVVGGLLRMCDGAEKVPRTSRRRR